MNHSSQIKNREKTITILNELNNLDWFGCKSIIPLLCRVNKNINKI